MVTSFSSIHSPPATQLYRIRKTDATVEGIVLNPLGWLHETKRMCIINSHPENQYPTRHSYLYIIRARWE